MTRSTAIRYARDYFDSGAFQADLARRVAIPTESGRPESVPVLRRYLEHEMAPAVERLGAAHQIVDNPVAGHGPFLVAHRHEANRLPTVLTYGHADVVPGDAGRWRPGLDPWRLIVEGDRWYGRGSADNKGQHTINLAALEHVLRARNGRLGFNRPDC
ncbi:M20/M25/M40 family metallo-hydrolase [Actinoallomurus sp. CA-150999]|uniref:M20/M25/M40 family metallo-hydrolase n=1 Tax=Actinoallomurus sp. CA-150999 TaxID=3239887 RepID=UPI003D8DA2CF